MSLFGFVKKAVNTVGKGVATVGNVAKVVTKLPITKQLAGGLAFVFPPVGVPLAAGIAVADKVIAGYNSVNPQKKETAARIVNRTKVLAASGDVGAQRAYSIMSQRAAAARAAGQFQVLRTGHVRRKA